ncbi:MAG TPA: sugar phosphate isomerase/epimerase family protein [Gemmataceae bacterium]|jgi:sugar phosphate isomerase/epimerase|nr:sugar phosphate isomerase/epimerase family protein [Gemmataceae bacterium]
MHTRRQFLATAAGTAVIAGTTPGADTAGSPLKFRLGIVTYNIAANWDLPTLLRILQQTKISAVEFRTGHKHGVEPSLSAEQRKDVRRRCQDAGVAIWGCGTTCEFHSPDKAEVEKQIETCKRFVQLVHDLGGRGVKVRPNGLPRGVPVEKTLEQIGKSLIPCGRAAADAGLEIFVEVHGNGTQKPANMKAIMEHCGHSPVGVCWNSNAEDVKNGSVQESFALLNPWIKSCHINELYKDAAGVYPYRELFRLLRESGYDRVTLCEVGKTPKTEDDGAEILRYYKALWTELTRV